MRGGPWSGIAAVARRELVGYLASPAVWAAAGLFVLVAHALFFFLGYPVGEFATPGFWEGREATLRTLFAWLPLLLVVLAPALAMGGWAEERRAGTSELLLSYPLRVSETVVGKFLAAWFVLAVALVAATLPLAAVVASLGPLDWGVVGSGLLGALLLGATSLALSLACSAFAGEQLSAFALAATLLGALWASALFLRFLPPSGAELVRALSPTVHFLDGAAVGVLDLRDAVYHAVVTACALCVNGLAVEAYRWR